MLHAVKKLSKESWSVQVVHHMPGFSPSTSGMPGMPEISLAVAPEQFRQGRVKLQVPLMSARLLTADPHEGEMSQAERWVMEDYILLVVEMFAQDVFKNAANRSCGFLSFIQTLRPSQWRLSFRSCFDCLRQAFCPCSIVVSWRHAQRSKPPW